MPTAPPRSAAVRTALAAATVLAALALLVAIMWAVDTALSIVERLRAGPTWIAVLVSLAFVALVVGSAWVAWRLWRGPRGARRRGSPAPAPTREVLEARLESAGPRAEAAAVASRLARSDAHAGRPELRVALFGPASAGKTSLLRALAGRDDLAVDPRGGTTLAPVEVDLGSRAHAYRFVDLPGFGTPGIDAATARDEAVAAHVLVQVCESDLRRDEVAALQALLDLGKPTVLVLNKRDRYDAGERAALVSRLGEQAGHRALVVEASGGGEEEVEVVAADGTASRRRRARPAEVGALLDAVDALAAAGRERLEPARQQAVVASLSQELSGHEARWRAADAEAIVGRYTRRAVVGALAAVAPGSDLVIQGALAAAMLRELTACFGLGLRDVDLDAFIAQATRRARTSAAVVLAIAGNALKAFPGAGTVGGGLLHAVAYGLIFDALGRAVAASLASARTLDAETLAQFDHTLQHPAPGRLAQLARLALSSSVERPREGR